MYMEFETKIKHHEAGETLVSITDCYNMKLEQKDCYPRVKLSVKDKRGLAGSDSQVTLTLQALEEVILLVKKYQAITDEVIK